MNIDLLVPYENNPRFNDEAVEYVANSIKEFGFKVPIIIDKNNVIIAGHTRLKAAQKLGITDVPVIKADDLTEDQVKAFRLADNKTGEIAAWDFNKLDAELYNIDLDMKQFDFAFNEMTDDLFNEEFSLPDDEKPQSRTITLTLSEDQYLICTNCMDYIKDNDLVKHDFGNHNKRSNYLFEVIYQWAEQKTLL